MSDYHLTQCCFSNQAKIMNDMAKVRIKSEKLTSFGGIFAIMMQFNTRLSKLMYQHFEYRLYKLMYQLLNICHISRIFVSLG